jgi:RNA polymerase sigma-70 factor (ECF subfamily)
LLLRRIRSRDSTSSSEITTEAAEVIAGERYADLPDPREFVERSITALDVQAALARLSLGHRQVIIEIYYRDRSVSETAEILGIPPGTVKSRRHYSLGQLRRAMHRQRVRETR